MATRVRIAALFAVLLVLLGGGLTLTWRWRASLLVRHKLEAYTGHRVAVGAVELTWGFALVAHDVVVMGAPPFDAEVLAHLERVVVGLRGHFWRPSPAHVLVDGAEIEYLATGDSDNWRGSRGRRSAALAPALSQKAPWPRITVRNARLRGQIELASGPRFVLRASSVEIDRDQAGLIVGKLSHLVADADGLASLVAAAVAVDVGRGSALRVSGTQVGVSIPGGGTLLENLTVLGQGSSQEGSLVIRDLGVSSNPGSEGKLQVTGTWQRDRAELSLIMHELPLRALSTLAESHHLGLQESKADLVTHLVIDRSARQASVTLAGGLHGLDIIHPAIDTQPWQGQSLAFSAQAQVGGAPTRIDISEASLTALGATVKVRGTLEDMQAPRGSLVVYTPPSQSLSCPALLLAQPAPVRQALDGLGLRGRLGFKVKTEFDALSWEDLQLDVDLGPICAVTSDTKGLADLLPALRDPKRLPPPAAAKIPLGVFHPDFVALASMPAHLPAAFITSEDAKFFHHRGFDLDMIRRALSQDLANRSFTRGASTITQQLAKNLFLTQRRTVARKLEEAVLTWRLQRLLTKNRVLELYLNMIELGPGVRGVRQAARRYFGKEIRDLAPMESAHLAALAPNPHVLARRFRDGQVDESWQERLYDLLEMMRRHHRLSAEELSLARASKLRLRDLGRSW